MTPAHVVSKCEAEYEIKQVKMTFCVFRVSFFELTSGVLHYNIWEIVEWSLEYFKKMRVGNNQ